MSKIELSGLPPIFGECVLTDEYPGRYALKQPWRFNDYIYATNSRIAVRMKSIGPDTRPEEGKKTLPDVSGLSWDLNDYEAWHITVPEVNIPDPEKCDVCDGSGKYECEECGGTGYYECDHCGHEVECDECYNESPSGDCDECDGTGTASPPEEAVVIYESSSFSCKLSDKYCNLLHRHNARLYLNKENPSKLSCYFEIPSFKKDGVIEGLVMPRIDW